MSAAVTGPAVRRWRLKVLATRLLAVLLLPLALLAGAGWLLLTEAGLAWALARAEGAAGGHLQITGASGRLAGPLTIAQIEYADGDRRYRVAALSLDWRPAALLALRLQIDSLHVVRIDIPAGADAGDSPPAPPAGELALPLALRVDRLQVDALHLQAAGELAGEPLLRDLSAMLESDGRQHRVGDLAVTLAAGTLRGEATLAASAPHGLGAAIDFTASALPLTVQARVAGPLAAPEITFEATLAADTAPGSAATPPTPAATPSAPAASPSTPAAPPSVTAAGRADLRPFARQPLAALRLTIEGFDPQRFAAAAPRAQLAVAVELAAEADDTLAGRLRLDNARPATLDRGGLPFSRLDSRVRLHAFAEAPRLNLDELRLLLAPSGAARSPGRVSGSVTAQWAIAEAAGLPAIDADLEVADLDPSALHSALQAMSLAGRIRLAADAGRQQATLALGDGTRRLAAELARQGDAITLASLRLAQGDAELSGSGDFRLDAGQAWRIEGRLRDFDPAVFVSPAAIDLAGSRLNARFAATGRLRPQLEGALDFTVADSRLAGEAFSASGALRFAGIEEPARLLAGDGSATLKGRLDLRLGATQLAAAGGWGGPAERLQFSATAPELARHPRLLPGFAGRIEVNGELAGWPSHPDLALSVQAAGLSLPGGERIDAARLAAAFNDRSLALRLSADGLANGDEPTLASLVLTLSGTRAAHRAQAVAELAGGTRVEAALQGGLPSSIPASLAAGRLVWRGELASLAVRGDLPFALRQAAPLTLDYAHDALQVALGVATLSFADGSVVLDESRWTPAGWQSAGHFAGLALRPGEAPEGAVEPLRLAGAWSLAGLPPGGADARAWLTATRGWLRVRREGGDWLLPGILPPELRRAELSAASLDAELIDGRARLDLRVAGGRIGRWRAELALPLAAAAALPPDRATAPLEGWLQAAVDDLQWLAPAIDGNFTSGGSLTLDARLTGTLGEPQVDGFLRGNGLAFGMIDQGVQLQGGELRVRFDRQQARIEALHFEAPHAPPRAAARAAGIALPAPPGRLEVQGDFDFAAGRGSLRASLARVPLSQRPERWLVASGSARLTYADERLIAEADLVADAGYIAEAGGGTRPALADDVVVLGRDEAPRRPIRVAADLGIDLGDRFHLRVAGLSARLAGRLRLRGGQGEGEARLSATGSIATQDATFDAYGQRLAVERGIVNFQGPLDDPGLNVLALRKGGEVEAGVTVTGTVQRPVVRLVSTPPVPDAEKLSWIVLGRPPDAGGVDASLLINAAGSILGGGEGVSGQIAQRFGIDELSLRPEDSQEPLAGQVLVLGKRLSARTHLGYEQGLSTASRAVRLTHALTPRISVVTRAGGDNAIDIFYSLSFD
jgi:translocation and assembly module TamB